MKNIILFALNTLLYVVGYFYMVDVNIWREKKEFFNNHGNALATVSIFFPLTLDKNLSHKLFKIYLMKTFTELAAIFFN